MYSNIIYIGNINPIGGVETVVYNVAKKYSNKDITVMYIDASSEQLYRLSKYCKVEKLHKCKCKRLFVNYGWENVKDYIEFDEGYYIVHANYKFLNSLGHEHYTVPEGLKVLAVSDYAGQNCGADYEVFYNPVVVNDQDSFLIVSATRLADDKGDIMDRMLALAERLDERGIPFLWLVFSNSSRTFQNKSIVSVPSRLDIHPFLKKADFVAQLSSSEACCMTVMESLALNTPVLCTKIPSFYEEGLNEDNSIFFDFDMSNVDECIDKMLNKKFNFVYSPPKDRWGEYLIDGRKEEIKPLKLYKVKATGEYQRGGGIICKELGRVPFVGEEFVITEDKIDTLCKGKNGYNAVFAEIVQEIDTKVEETEEKPKKRGRKKAE